MITPPTHIRPSAGVVLASAALFLAGCAGSSPASDSPGSGGIEDMEPVTFIVSEPLPPNSSNNQGTNLWMDYVTEHTDGKVTFEVYDSSTLHPMGEALTALESGLSDITLYIPGLFPTDTPVGAWGTLLASHVGPSPTEILAGIPASMAAFGTGPVASELADHNAVLLGSSASDNYTLLCKSPIASLADARGMLTRTTGGSSDGEAESVGLVSVLLDATEVYEGLQRGAIDCQLGSMNSLVREGLWEVAKYYVPLQFGPPTGAGYIMNKEKYDALPDAVKAVFAEAAPLIGIGNSRALVDAYITWYSEAPDHSVEFVTPEADLVNTLAEYRAEQGALAAEGAPASVSDPQAVIDVFTTTYDDWVDILADEFGIEPSDGTPEELEATFEQLDNDFDWELFRQRVAEYVAGLG
jgi:TRAP-type transport system periplasmic protein